MKASYLFLSYFFYALIAFTLTAFSLAILGAWVIDYAERVSCTTPTSAYFFFKQWREPIVLAGFLTGLSAFVVYWLREIFTKSLST